MGNTNKSVYHSYVRNHIWLEESADDSYLKGKEVSRPYTIQQLTRGFESPSYGGGGGWGGTSVISGYLCYLSYTEQLG